MSPQLKKGTALKKPQVTTHADVQASSTPVVVCGVEGELFPWRGLMYWWSSASHGAPWFHGYFKAFYLEWVHFGASLPCSIRTEKPFSIGESSGKFSQAENNTLARKGT